MPAPTIEENRQTATMPAALMPPAPTVFDTLWDYRRLIAALALLGALIGLVYGLARNANYESEARLSVGRIDVETQAIPGFAQAALALADIYSRAIVAGPVLEDVAEDTGLGREEVLERVTASPIPQTPVLSVFAEGDSEAEAVDLANESGNALRAYIRRLNRFNPDTKIFLQQYLEASQRREEAERSAEATGTPESYADVAAARLEQQSAANLYVSSQAGQAAPNTLQILAVATSADSDRGSVLQRALLVGLALGALLGIAIALARSYRHGLL